MTESITDNKKSYFYVFLEEDRTSEQETGLISAFNLFKKIHCKDSEVEILTPDDKRFEEARVLFTVRRTPAFVLVDEPLKLEKESNPFITFERGVINRYMETGLYNLITDIHYLLKDENILRVSRRMANSALSHYAGRIYDEIKDFVRISVSR